MAKVVVKLPSDVTKADNGRVSDALLSPCGVFAHSSPNRELKMHHLHAARAMRMMSTEASTALNLGKIRGVDSYRNLQRQTVAFDGTDPKKRNATDGRYVPEELWGTFGPGQLVDDDVRKWKDKLWKRRKGTEESAVPGESNHGWGLAIDFAGDQIDTLLPWLKTNAERFGFVNDNRSEKWHWSYKLGDEPAPALSLGGTDDQPEGDDEDAETSATTQEDADMRVIDLAPNTPSFTRLVISGRVKWVRGGAASVLDKLKVTTLEVNRDELKDVMRTFGTDGLSPFNAVSRNSAPDPELDALWEQSRL